MAITINGTGTLTGVSVGGLPDGIVDTDMLAASAVTAAKSSGLATTNGITMAESWRVTSEYTTDSGNTVYPSSGWEKDDNNRAGSIGSSGMSESSGIFTFPSTGIYQVTWQGYGRAANSSASTINGVGIYATGNNSSYSVVSISYFTCPNESTYNYAFGEAKAIIDVTDTSNVKVKFGNYSANYMTWEVSSGYNLNCATFIRLGDT